MFLNDQEVNIFTNFTDEEKEKFLSICDTVSVNANENILEEGQLTRSLFIIKKGSVSVFLEVNGDRIDVAKLKENDFFGEMSFIDGKIHSANIISTEPSELYVVRKFKFDSFSKQNPEIAKKLYENMIRCLFERLRHSNNIIKKLKEEANGIN